jgi:hypothetical protein
VAGGSTAALLRRVAAQTKSLPRKVVEESSKSISKAVKSRLKVDAGGDSSLSGAPSRLSVRVTVKGRGKVVTGEIMPTPKRSMAQWSWLEYGTNPHTIRKGQVIYSKAKGTWTKAIDPEIEALIKDARVKFGKIVRG